MGVPSYQVIEMFTQDWELECAKMAHIYQDSIGTICAPAALDNSVGFLAPRTCPEPIPQLWKYKNPGDPGLRV